MQKLSDNEKGIAYQVLKFLFTVWCFIFLFIFIGCLAYLMNHTENVTLTFTNIGFAVFLAFGNTCFSWARTITNAMLQLIVNRINRVGYFSIFCAIIFVISSFLQFLLANKVDAASDSLIIKSFYSIVFVSRGLTILIFLALSFGILFEVLSIIFKMFLIYVPLDDDKKIKI